MTAGLKPYAAMRDSGVEWLGKLPEHWEVRRLGTIADMRVSNVNKHIDQREQRVRLWDYLDVRHEDPISADVSFMAGTARRSEIRKFRLAVGDVLVTKDSEDWTDLGVPALLEYAADDAAGGPAAVRPEPPPSRARPQAPRRRVGDDRLGPHATRMRGDTGT